MAKVLGVGGRPDHADDQVGDPQQQGDADELGDGELITQQLTQLREHDLAFRPSGFTGDLCLAVLRPPPDCGIGVLVGSAHTPHRNCRQGR